MHARARLPQSSHGQYLQATTKIPRDAKPPALALAQEQSPPIKTAQGQHHLSLLLPGPLQEAIKKCDLPEGAAGKLEASGLLMRNAIVTWVSGCKELLMPVLFEHSMNSKQDAAKETATLAKALTDLGLLLTNKT